MNTKIKCLLLDDELPGLAYLKLLCEQLPEVQVVKAFDDPHKLLQSAHELDFDLCVMDIQMPGLNGLEVAKALTGKLIIFTTAFKEYASEAFDLNAIDYIKKPIDAQRLRSAFEKAAMVLRMRGENKTHAVFNTHLGKTIVQFSQILRISTSPVEKRDKLLLLDNGQKLLLKNISFTDLLAILPPSQFSRINKSDIIAFRTVESFTYNSVQIKLPFQEERRTLVLGDNFRNAFKDRF